MILLVKHIISVSGLSSQALPQAALDDSEEATVQPILLHSELYFIHIVRFPYF